MYIYILYVKLYSTVLYVDNTGLYIPHSICYVESIICNQIPTVLLYYILLYGKVERKPKLPEQYHKPQRERSGT